MILNDSMKLSLADRMGVRTEGLISDLAFTFWSGTMPTFAEFKQAEIDRLISHPSETTTYGRLSAKKLTEYFISRGSVELATAYFGSLTTSEFYKVINKNQILIDTSTGTIDFTVFAEGQAGFFTVIHVPSTATSINWNTDDYSIQHMVMGTVGLYGSGADQEISDVDVTFAKTIKPGTVIISI